MQVRLEELPVHILRKIANALPRMRDVRSFMQTCKRIHVTLAQLYIPVGPAPLYEDRAEMRCFFIPTLRALRLDEESIFSTLCHETSYRQAKWRFATGCSAAYDLPKFCYKMQKLIRRSTHDTAEFCRFVELLNFNELCCLAYSSAWRNANILALLAPGNAHTRTMQNFRDLVLLFADELHEDFNNGELSQRLSDSRVSTLLGWGRSVRSNVKARVVLVRGEKVLRGFPVTSISILSPPTRNSHYSIKARFADAEQRSRTFTWNKQLQCYTSGNSGIFFVLAIPDAEPSFAKHRVDRRFALTA